MVSINADKVPPFDLDAEQAVLASCLIDGDVVRLLGDILTPRHFYREGNGLIFGAIQRLAAKDEPIDMLTVKDELGARLDDAGGFHHLVDLTASMPTTAHAERYARTVRDKATLRGLIAAGASIAEGAFNPDANAEEMHARAVSLISGLEVADGSERDDDMEAYTAGWLARIEERGDTSMHSLVFDSAWYDLDHLWTGARGDLNIVAARPAMGKTAWSISYAWHVAKYGDTRRKNVHFWSIEMDRDRLMDRLALMLEGVDYKRLKDGKLLAHEWEAVSRTARRVRESGLLIIGQKNVTAAGVRRKALKQIGRGIGVDLVVVDYLGLMQHPKADRHDLAVGATSRALKLFAGEARCQVMALAQLNRALDKDTQKRPALTNLRDSGSLEQDADAVIFLHREAYFDPKAEQEGPCEVIIAKHRNGGIGTVPLHFEPKRQRFLVPQADVPDWSIA